jgi:hypothetical protein
VLLQSGLLLQGYGGVLAKSCAIALILTGLVHSILGERRLIGPLLAQRDGVLNSGLARFLLRAVWHFMTLLFGIIAVAIWVEAGSTDGAMKVLLLATAIGVGGAGLYDAVGSRGQHVGWPMLVAIGVLALLAWFAHA